MKNTYAPVLICTLNRYDHFRQCLDSLERCVGADKTNVYVALDYPPTEKYVEGWRKIDEYLEQKEKSNGFQLLKVYRREKNYGIKGLNSNGSVLHRDVLGDYERYIISEDDNVFSPNFLEYMNSCLERYEDDPEIVMVTGYSFPVGWRTSDGATVQRQSFNASAWGAGRWKKKQAQLADVIKSGEMYNMAVDVLKSKSYKKGLFVAFYEYMCASIIPIDYFRKIKSGRLGLTDYAIRQYLFVYDKKVISPIVSKVRNIGVDGSGAYCQNNNHSDGSGTRSWNTFFDQQAIDQNESFEIVENDPILLEKNRDILNQYEWRPLKQHIIANMIALGIRLLGLGFMRRFTSVVLKVWHRRIS